jgi:putative flavoprotein involved in K+ transport
VVASGGYHTPIVPRMAERLPAQIVQLQSSEYRNPQALPDGAVLVVGSGQSGAQIAEDLHLAGRKVVLAVGEAPRCARFYRGRDVVDWLADMKYYDMPVQKHPLREGVRDNTNHYVTGRDGGRDIDLRKFAAEGMELYGRLDDLRDGRLHFAPNLTANLDDADDTYNRINASIDGFIEKNGIDAPPGGVYEPLWQPPHERTTLELAGSGITSIIWCIGFTPDFSWIDAPVFNGRGYPAHTRGITPVEGLYFIGLPWLHTWGSGRFSGIARDADYVTQAILASLRERTSSCDTVAA